MSNVVSLGMVADSNKMITPEMALEDALSEIRSGERKCNKVLILTLDDENDFYNHGFLAANIKTSEMLALVTHTAHMLNKILDGEG